MAVKNKLITQLPELQKEGYPTQLNQADFNEWLVCLSRTKDFNHSRAELAQMACLFLASACDNKEFQGLFLQIISANNERCEDRSAQTFNLIYSAWVSSGLGGTPQEIVGIAKMGVVREIVSRLIAEQEEKILEKETPRIQAEIDAQIPEGLSKDEEARLRTSLFRVAEKRLKIQESVEIYLYVECELQKNYPSDIPPCSAIKTMSYPEIGKREWIDLDAIILEIEEKYLQHLVTMDACPAKTIEDAKKWVENLSIGTCLAYPRLKEGE